MSYRIKLYLYSIIFLELEHLFSRLQIINDSIKTSVFVDSFSIVKHQYLKVLPVTLKTLNTFL